MFDPDPLINGGTEVDPYLDTKCYDCIHFEEPSCIPLRDSLRMYLTRKLLVRIPNACGGFASRK